MKKQIGIRLSPADVEMLDAIAERSGTTRSHAMRLIIRQVYYGRVVVATIVPPEFRRMDMALEALEP